MLMYFSFDKLFILLLFTAICITANCKLTMRKVCRVSTASESLKDRRLIDTHANLEKKIVQWNDLSVGLDFRSAKISSL